MTAAARVVFARVAGYQCMLCRVLQTDLLRRELREWQWEEGWDGMGCAE